MSRDRQSRAHRKRARFFERQRKRFEVCVERGGSLLDQFALVVERLVRNVILIVLVVRVLARVFRVAKRKSSLSQVRFLSEVQRHVDDS